MKDKLVLWLKGIWAKLKRPLIYFSLFCGVVGIAYIAGRCSTKAERKAGIHNLIAARDSVNTYSVTIDGLKNTVFEKDAIILSQKEAIEVGIIEKERLRKLHIKELITNVELQGRIKILEDSLDLPPDVKYITVKDSSGKYNDYIKIPFVLLNIHRKDSVDLIAGLGADRRAYWELDIPFSAEMSIGYQKDGFLKTKPTGILTTTNPYLTIDRMDVLILKKERRWFQKTWVHVLFGGALIEGLNIIIPKK